MNPYLIVAPLVLGTVLLIDSIEVINPGEVGVPVTLGTLGNDTLKEGVHFATPLITSVKKFDVQEKSSQSDVDAITRDTQTLPNVQVNLNWRVNAANANSIVRDFGTPENLFSRVLNPATEEAVKATTAQFTAAELISKRQEFASALQSRIKERVKDYPVDIVRTNITNFSFSPGFTKAIEDKQIAAQLEAKVVAEARAKVEQARGEADARRLQQQTVTPLTIRLQELENQSEMIKKWNGQMPVYSGNGGNFLMQLPANQ